MIDDKEKTGGVLGDIEQRVQGSVEELVGIKNGVVLVGAPEHIKGVDFGVNVAGLAKRVGQSSVKLAEDLARVLGEKIEHEGNWGISKVVSTGPFVNMELDMGLVGQRVVGKIIEQAGDYGKEKEVKKGKVVVDMSSPNIAKRMSYGHLRSTVIGAAIANLYEVGGYEVIRDNHIGDWGTQFGKLIVAIEKWGDLKELKKATDPVAYLQKLYVKFHSEVDSEAEVERGRLKEVVREKGLGAVPELASAVDEVSREIMERKGIGKEDLNMETVLEDALDRVVETELEKEGRKAFSKLEKGDKQVRKLWQMCVDLSMKEFEKIYGFLGVTFDVVLGESFYEDKLAETIKLVEKSGCGEISDGALVVNMEDKKLGTAIVRKSDGASVYMTRDLACGIYRGQEMKVDKAIYVVGEDQKLYFRQVFEILKRLGYEIGDKSEHVYFGMVKLKEGKMSTRKGRTILLKDVIEEGVSRVEKMLKEKGVKLSKETVRQIVAGALKWNDLGQDVRRSIVFDWDDALNMQGYSAPYVQYAAVRAGSLLEKAGYDRDLAFNVKEVNKIYEDEAERDLIKILMKYAGVLVEARESSDPSKLAAYLYSLAKQFSSFYNGVQVIGSKDSVKLSRLRLVDAVLQVIKNGLGVLGIEVPERM